MGALLSPILKKRLTNIKITSKRMVRGGYKGERRSQRLGTSFEFSDYRLYHPGDDLRQLDWNTYARTGKYYIKRFLDEQELAVMLYVDCTKSMGIDQSKWQRAKQLTAVFSFLSLSNSDRLGIIPVTSESRILPFTKGKAMTNKTLGYINDMVVARTNKSFGKELVNYSNRARGNNLTIIISDFLDNPDHLFQAIKNMQGRRQQVILVQVLMPGEKDPTHVGDLKLIDIETGGERDVSMNRKVIENYKQLFNAHTLKMKSFCNARGIDFLTCLTTDSLEETIFSLLMGKGLIGR